MAGVSLSRPSFLYPPPICRHTEEVRTRTGRQGDRESRSAVDLGAGWLGVSTEPAACASVRGRESRGGRERQAARGEERRGEGEQALSSHEDGLLFSGLS